MRAALVVLSLTLAGCLSPIATPPESASGPREAWFAPGNLLEAAPPGGAASVRSGSFFEAWQAGDDYPTWQTPAQDSDIIIDNVTVSLVVRVTGPVVRTFRFPDFMAYAGSGEAWMAIGTIQTDPALAPGQTYHYDISVAPPAGGLFVPRGEPFGIKVVPVMHQNDAFDVEILMGGESASKVNWTQIAAPVTTGAYTRGGGAGEVSGSAYMGAATPASANYRLPIEVNATPAMMLGWMNTTNHDGIPDLDFSVIGPDGTVLAFSGTPTPQEMVRLGPANLQASGTYTLVATSYGSARAAMTIEWAWAELDHADQAAPSSAG